jgi:hypothetical protein
MDAEGLIIHETVEFGKIVNPVNLVDLIGSSET